MWLTVIELEETEKKDKMKGSGNDWMRLKDKSTV